VPRLRRLHLRRGDGAARVARGQEGQPRFKPPFPASYGLYGKPTTINNTETFAAVPWIIMNGGQAYLDVGKPNNGGTKIFSVVGDVQKPGNYEVPLGTPFTKLLELAGGVPEGRTLKAVIPGGSSAPVLPASIMNELTMDYDAIAKAGSMLGSGAVIVMDDSRSMVHSLLRLSYFYMHESCGQCTPCREGTGWLYRMVERIANGQGRMQDIDLLNSVSDNIQGRTICALGDAGGDAGAGDDQALQGRVRRPDREDAAPVHAGKIGPADSVNPGAHRRRGDAAVRHGDARRRVARAQADGEAMIEIDLDGQKVSVPEGSMVMHAADKAGTYIPHFCYHKKLSIAANCRMCLVEIEKAPKPMPACATPVTQGMVVKTKSDKAINAQQGVMEFLLINHPLDCPICDQGGECQLQDLAVGYGASSSRYDEDKRVVYPKDVGPLLSMQEMNRCIHCTRCIRFGVEVGGVMELGMIHRGEHSEITTVAGDTVDSELSGNMIDLCPVGAITSKPFRYSARAWELSRRKGVSPHDSTGANLIVQVKGAQVVRVLPLENEDVNECWLADRDRFSYEALNTAERLTVPMIRQGGEWKTVSWTDALDYVSRGLTQIAVEHGAQSIGALASPMSTLEELHLLAKLVRGLGSDNVDTRLREAQARASARCAGSAGRSRRSPSCSASSSSARSCARTIRSSRNGSARRPRRAPR
jgi:hypothetical protein